MRRVTRRRWFLPVGLAVGALTLSACYGGNPTGPVAADLGDSITDISVWPINNALAPDYQVNVIGQDGYTIGDSLAQLNTMLTDPRGAPNDFILELGTNDVFQQNSLWWVGMEDEVTAVQNVPCVIFVNVPTQSDYFGDLQGLPAMVPSINQTMANEVAAHSNFHLIDWAGFVDTGDNFNTYIDSSEYGLGVHPNAAGQQVLAAMELTAVQQDCGS